MKSAASYLIVLAMTALPALLLFGVVRVTVPADWRRRLRMPMLGLLGLGLLGVIVWATGHGVESRLVSRVGATMAAVASVVTVPLCVAVPFASLVRLAGQSLARAESPRAAVAAAPASAPDSRDALETDPAPSAGATSTTAGATPESCASTPDPAALSLSSGRRAFLRAAVGAAPALSLAGSGVGLVSALPGPRIHAFDLALPGLPPALDGLRVLQITDAHVGTFTSLDHLASGLERAAAHAPDLVLVTGDLSDHLPALPEALRLIADLRPRLGAWAVPGNHEYHRGIDDVLAIHAASEVPIRRSEGLLVPAPGWEPGLWLAFADDPANRALGPDRRLARSIDRAMEGRPDGAPAIVLSHRPYGFARAAHHGALLTLAGHTHGLQMALGGRSVGEALFPNHYLLGVYRRGPSRLYTSAGAGHWFPFRLGCPAELPLITLRSAVA